MIASSSSSEDGLVRGDANQTIRIITAGCVEVCRKPEGSQRVTTEVLVDGEFFGALPTLDVANRMGAVLVRAMSQVECFALTDEAVRNVLTLVSPGRASRPATGDQTTRPTSKGRLKTPRRPPSRLATREGREGDPLSATSRSSAGRNNGFTGDGSWVSVEVQKVPIDTWTDATRADDSVLPAAPATPSRAAAANSQSRVSSRTTTPCKPTTPCSRRPSLRRQNYRVASSTWPCRPCSREAAGGDLPGTPSMAWSPKASLHCNNVLSEWGFAK